MSAGPDNSGPVPDVSVVIAAYNAEATLERAVASCLVQRGCEVEVLVSDDASRDGTLSLAHRLAEGDSRVVVLSAERNGGPSAARNLALDVARGRYAAVLDSDDMMDPDRLMQLVAAAEDGDWDFTADDLYRVTEGQEEGERTRLLGGTIEGHEPIDLATFVEGNLTTYNGARGELGFLKPLMSMEFIRKTGLRYREDMRLGEDFAFYAEALVEGARFCLVKPAGYLAVMRKTSLSGQHDTAALHALVHAGEALLMRADLSAEERGALKRHRIDTMKRWAWMRLIDAVKARDVGECFRSFLVPIPVGKYLVSCMSEQVVLRSRERALTALNRRLQKGETPD
ncbi:glycosyltransferase family 2 protein [Marinibacterium profundimaris]|uniref:glycosyltransferase family 2 protein n=1 Tax=Marinibacterium profundimaris TaxID=1679460 RepID=UPI000B5263C4|nr:glycosyltransferase family 2 protein [Marinibacterium profundimaris]